MKPLGYHDMTCEEVAARMGNITPTGVYSLEKSALNKLRRNPEFRKLLECLGRERRTNNLGTAYEGIGLDYD